MQLTLEAVVVGLVIVAAQFIDPLVCKSIIINSVGLAYAFFRWRPIELILTVSFGIVFRLELAGLVSYLAVLSGPSQIFLFLFVFKFLKVFIHTISYNVYRPPRRKHATVTSQDCTVIIPTIGDMGGEFVETVQSILACDPAGLIISTAGAEKLKLAQKVCAQIDPRILCIAIDTPNKRKQFIAAVNRVNTPITITADDHVFWPATFLQAATTSFEDPHVGLVGTGMRGRRVSLGWGSIADLLNFVACVYLERHNFDCTASYNIDGGVFVISGRTVLFRSSIIQSTNFQREFLNEHWLFGRIGPMNVDDDNFFCRWTVTHRYGIGFHYSPDAMMVTTLGLSGGWKKFRGQLDRWARTTWRSNSTTLFADRTVWWTQPWSVYAVYFSAFVNFPLFYDPALFVTLYFSSFYSVWAMKWLAILLFVSKLIKPLPHYMRNPQDLGYLPFQVLFGYYYSLVKLNALWTCTNIDWGTRAC